MNFLSNYVHIYTEQLMCVFCQAIKQLFILIYNFDHTSQNCWLEFILHKEKLKLVNLSLKKTQNFML